MRRLNRLASGLLFTLLLLVTSSSAYAHPHVWIDLRIKPLMNAQGELLGLQQAWRFDPFYSLVLIEELERGGAAAELEARYDQLGLEIINNLNGVRFFTRGEVQVTHQTTNQTANQTLQANWGKVTDYTLLRIGQRLELRFFLPLNQPLLLTAAPFNYQIYDPTYYIEMLHAEEAGLDSSALTKGCLAEVHAPQPSPHLIEQAYALDKTETAEDPLLGLYFAESVTLKCPE